MTKLSIFTKSLLIIIDILELLYIYSEKNAKNQVIYQKKVNVRKFF